MTRVAPLLMTLILLLVVFPTASAHVPLEPSGNEGLGAAYPVSDPAKSWVLYGRLRPEMPQYYMFDVDEGQRILIGLIVPLFERERDFDVDLALIGPGLPAPGEMSEALEIPEGFGLVRLDGRLPVQATYEPFSPGSFYEVGELDLVAPSAGTFYIAVFSASEGSYGLVLGFRESFTLEEWVATPLDLVVVYQWSGQSLFLILAPWATVLAAGTGLLLWRHRSRRIWGTPSLWLGAMAGLLFLGSGASVLIQMTAALSQTGLVPEAAITGILALLPLVLGGALLRLILKEGGQPTRRTRVKIAILGLLGLVVWAGLLIGPALALAASLAPGPRSHRLHAGLKDAGP